MYLDSYLSILKSLAHGWQWKLPLAFIGSELMQRIALLFEGHFEFVALLSVLVIIDLATGIKRARRDGMPFNSYRLRRTGMKVIEYVVLLLCV